jgi:hypothetical protein
MPSISDPETGEVCSGVDWTMDPQPESDAKNASFTIPEGKAELTARLWPFEHGRSTLFELAVASCPA